MVSMLCTPSAVINWHEFCSESNSFLLCYKLLFFCCSSLVLFLLLLSISVIFGFLPKFSVSVLRASFPKFRLWKNACLLALSYKTCLVSVIFLDLFTYLCVEEQTEGVTHGKQASPTELYAAQQLNYTNVCWYVWVFCLHVSVHHLHAWCPQRPLQILML